MESTCHLFCWTGMLLLDCLLVVLVAGPFVSFLTLLRLVLAADCITSCEQV